MPRNTEARGRAIGAERRREVSRGHNSRNSRGGEQNRLNRRPERYPETGLKERRSRLPRNGVNVSGETTLWDENGVGAVRNDAPVALLWYGVRIRPMSLCFATYSAEPPDT